MDSKSTKPIENSNLTDSRLSTRIFEEMKVAGCKLSNSEHAAPSPRATRMSASQEELLQTQRDMQYLPICNQEAKYAEWLEEDRELIGTVVASTGFAGAEGKFDEWYQCGFAVTGVANRDKGMQLRNFIIRSSKPISLRALSCEIRFNVRLYGDSTLWIITRGQSCQDPKAAICKISKELDCPRAFISLGGPTGYEGRFSFFKQQELTGFTEPSTSSALEDYIDIRIKYYDNGDDKIWVECLGNYRGKSLTMV